MWGAQAVLPCRLVADKSARILGDDPISSPRRGLLVGFRFQNGPFPPSSCACSPSCSGGRSASSPRSHFTHRLAIVMRNPCKAFGAHLAVPDHVPTPRFVRPATMPGWLQASPTTSRSLTSSTRIASAGARLARARRTCGIAACCWYRGVIFVVSVARGRPRFKRPTDASARERGKRMRHTQVLTGQREARPACPIGPARTRVPVPNVDLVRAHPTTYPLRRAASPTWDLRWNSSIMLTTATVVSTRSSTSRWCPASD